MQQSSEWRTTSRARIRSLAPMKWAVCTEKPIEAAPASPPKSQMVLSTKPMAAGASAPRLPTIAWSMKNIITFVICAKIDGMLNKPIRLSISPRVMSSPERILPSRNSVLAFDNICYGLLCPYLPFDLACQNDSSSMSKIRVE